MDGRSFGLVAIPVYDPPAGQVVWRKLDANPIAGRDPNPISSHPASGISDQLVAVLQLHLEHGVRERLSYDPVHNDGFLLLDRSLGLALSTPS
jgi:hypothetical protein